MSSYVKSNYKGSYYERGIADANDTNAAIFGQVAIAGGNIDTLHMLKEAADVAVAAAGTTHPSNSSLPAARVRATYINPERARTVLLYDQQPKPTPVPNVSVSEAEVRTIQMWDWASGSAVFTSGTTTSVNQVYDANSGQLQNAPRNVEIPIQVVRLSSSSLNFAPIGTTVMTQVNKINNATYAVGGRSWAAYEVRFDGVRQRYSKVGTTSTFIGEWQYSCRIGGWYQNDLTGTAKVTQNLMYGTAAFVDPPIS